VYLHEVPRQQEAVMQHPRIVLAAVGVAVVAAVGGGIAAAETGGSGPSYSGSGGTASSQPASAGALRTMQASVGGKSETILVDSSGMPVYYFQSDTATTSAVSGGLAAAWPSVRASSAPTSLAGGQVSSIQDSHGSQATYNGHPLYTFVSDQPGVVTGQGVENFFVVTPGVAPLSGAAAPAPSSATTDSGGGYSY
jgi:predicted lipoprotein with Yx(FWY)xxD motif